MRRITKSNSEKLKKSFNIILIALATSVLGGLLVAFMFFGTTEKKERALNITFPKIDEDGFGSGCMLNVITILLGKNERIFYYEGGEIHSPTSRVVPIGAENDTMDYSEKINLIETKLSLENGITDVLTNLDAEKLTAKLDQKKKRENMTDSAYQREINYIHLRISEVTVLVKIDNDAKYGDVVKLIDILKLKRISKFALLDLTESEKKALQEATK